MKINNRITIISLVLVMLILAGAIYTMRNKVSSNHSSGGNFLDTSPAGEVRSMDVSTWVAYSDSAAHISFSHPPSFSYERKSGEIAGYPNMISSFHFSNKETVFEYAVAENSNNYSLDDVLTNGPLLQYSKDSVKSSDVNTIKIDGVDAIMAKHVSASRTPSVSDVAFIRNGRVYQFVLEADNDPRNIELFETMLKTIKFTSYIKN